MTDPKFDAIRKESGRVIEDMRRRVLGPSISNLYDAIDAAEAAYVRRGKALDAVQGRLTRYVRSTEKVCDTATINQIMAESHKMRRAENE